MDERTIRIDIDKAALRRTIPEREPSQFVERVRRGTYAAAPIIQWILNRAYAAIQAVRR